MTNQEAFDQAVNGLLAQGGPCIDIDGTIDKPNVHTIKKPGEIIKRTGQIIGQNVGQILQGIFQ